MGTEDGQEETGRAVRSGDDARLWEVFQALVEDQGPDEGSRSPGGELPHGGSESGGRPAVATYAGSGSAVRE